MEFKNCFYNILFVILNIQLLFFLKNGANHSVSIKKYLGIERRMGSKRLMKAGEGRKTEEKVKTLEDGWIVMQE